MEILNLVISAIALIISIILLVLILKSKNKSNNNPELNDFMVNVRKSLDYNASYLRDLESRINDAFNAQTMMQNEAANALISRQNEQFSALRRELSESQASQRRELGESSSRILAEVQSKLNLIQHSNAESLEKIRTNVDSKLNETLTSRISSSFSTVNNQLQALHKSLGEMKELSNGVNNLNRVFANVKSRGTWAEYQLESLLDNTIPGMFERNFKPNPSKSEIVEFAIKIPTQSGSVAYIPVDSKFPVEDYMRIVDASQNADKAALEESKKALEARILAQAKEIRKYINEPVTTSFAIMYLPTEGLYSEVISSKSGLFEKCQNEFGIMIAGPSTISALLSSIQVGFHAMKINEKTEEIRKLLQVIKSQYDKFDDLLSKVRDNLDRAGQNLDKAVNRNEQIVKKLKSVDAVEISETEYAQLFENNE